MALCFSINHATVTAMIALATTSLGPTLGNTQTALLYTFYTITALFGASVIVTATGYKWGIVGGLMTYVIYVASFIVADKVPSVKTPAAYIGGSMGGIAAGFLWSAQGPYFAQNARLYAEAEGLEVNDVKTKWAAYFAIPYLGCEVFFKLMQTAIGSTGTATFNWHAGKDFIYVINTLCAVAACIGCMFIYEMPQPPAKKEDKEQSQIAKICEKSMAAGRLFFTNPKMPLMASMNIAFGIVSAYLNGYLIGQVASRYIGVGYAGYLASIIAVVAAMISIPNAFGLIPAEWARYYMFGGPVGFGLVVLLPIILGFGTLGNWGGLVTLFVLHGIGRGVWENTNKAIFAMYFAHDNGKHELGAFSNIIIQNGAASAIAFFVNAYGGATPQCPEFTINATSTMKCTEGTRFCMRNTNECGAYASEAWAGVIFSVLAIVGFGLASGLHAKGINTWAELRAGGGLDSEPQQNLIGEQCLGDNDLCQTK